MTKKLDPKRSGFEMTLKVGSGSEMTFKVGSASENNWKSGSGSEIHCSDPQHSLNQRHYQFTFEAV